MFREPAPLHMSISHGAVRSSPRLRALIDSGVLAVSAQTLPTPQTPLPVPEFGEGGSGHGTRARRDRTAVLALRAAEAALSRRMIRPNGGESWPAGSIQPLMWTSTKLAAGATIKLSYTDGAVTYPIASGLGRTAVSYNWRVPDTQGSSWKVTVCSEVGGVCEAQDSSDTVFSIVGPASPPARNDFNADGKPDLLWHNQSTGQLYVWFMNGIAQSSGSFLTPSSSTPVWQIRGIGDVNVDGKNDLLWHNQSTGQLYVWFMDGVTQSAATYFTPPSVNPVWQIRGLVDLNGDGKLDLLWHNQSTGQLYVWFMDGVTQSSASFLTPSSVNPVWQIRGVGDFNADAKPDLLWRNQSTGQLYVWFMNGVTLSSASLLTPASVANLAWQICQVSDFNADGKPDILWRNQSTGQLYVWFMNGITLSSASFLTPSQVSNTSWQVVPR